MGWIDRAGTHGMSGKSRSLKKYVNIEVQMKQPQLVGKDDQEEG